MRRLSFFLVLGLVIISLVGCGEIKTQEKATTDNNKVAVEDSEKAKESKGATTEKVELVLKSEKLSIETPSNTDAITIMTIHKSKGLQFPVVISTFTNWSLSYDADNVWIDTNNKQVQNISTKYIQNKNKVIKEFCKKNKIDFISIDTAEGYLKPLEQFFSTRMHRY